jgi:parvulin-like peptidyl-prolyl isomerase
MFDQVDGNTPLASMGNITLTVKDMLKALHRSRRLAGIIRPVFMEHFLVTKAKQAGIKVTQEEIQKMANDFRRSMNLTKAEDMNRWFQMEGITAADFAEGIERDLLVSKMRQAITEPQLQATFDAQADRFARVRVSRIALANQTDAEELYRKLTVEKLPFEEAAKTYSHDSHARTTGGMIGLLRRCDFTPEVGPAVFGTPIGEVTPPLPAQPIWLIFKVHEFLPAVLDTNTANLLRDEIMDRWLQSQIVPNEPPRIFGQTSGS